MVFVVGHRGAAGLLPENTVKGFRYAVDLGCEYVECDVHLTSDGRLVVIHNGEICADAPPKDVFMDAELSEDSQIDPPPIFHLIRTAACAENPAKK